MMLHDGSGHVNEGHDQKVSLGPERSTWRSVAVGTKWASKIQKADGTRKIVTVITSGPKVTTIEDGSDGRRQKLRPWSFLAAYAPHKPLAVRPILAASNCATNPLEELMQMFLDARRDGDRTTTIEVDLDVRLATALRDTNQHNRAPSAYVISKYIRDLIQERWPISHQGLAVGPTLILEDGQHRCAMVIETAKTARVLITVYWHQEDVDRARPTWDRNRTRSNANVLEILRLVRPRQGKHFSSTIEAMAVVDARLPSRPTGPEAAEIFVQRRTHLMAVHNVVSTNDFLSPARAALALMRMKNAREIDDFIEKVATAIELKEGTAALALHRKLHSQAADIQGCKTLGGKAATMKIVFTYGYMHILEGKGKKTKKITPKIKEDAAKYFLGTSFREPKP